MIKKVPSEVYDIKYEKGDDIYEENLVTKEKNVISIMTDELVTKDDNLMKEIFIALDDVDSLITKGKDKIIEVLTDNTNKYYELVKYYMDFHIEEVGEEYHEDLFGVKNAKELGIIEVAKLLKPKMVSVHLNKENKYEITLDFSYNSEITDELMVIVFNQDLDIIYVTHES